MCAMFLCGKLYLTFSRPVRQEFQFFPQRLLELQEIEYNAYRVSVPFRALAIF